MSKIIVSYRSEDTGSVSGRLDDFLVNRFGDDKVQLGLAGVIQPGDDFVEAIEDAVKNADVLAILIGNTWAEGDWLNDGNDYNHIAIKTALEAKTRIMPVTIDGASMPTADQVPEAFVSLTRRAGININTDSFRDDAGQLGDQLAKHVQTKPAPKPSTRDLSQQARSTPKPRPQPQPVPKPSVFTQPTPPPSTEKSPSMAFSSYGTTTLPQSEPEAGVAMPGFITTIMRGLFATFSDYITLMVVVAGLFAVGNVIELEYFIYNVDNILGDESFIYGLLLAGIFGVGIYVLMHGLSIATPRVTTGMALAVVIGYGATVLIISQLEFQDVFYAHSLLSPSQLQIAERLDLYEYINSIWAVRAVQAGIITLVVSELTAGAYSSDQTRLNVGLMIVLFVGLIGISFGYNELMGELLEVDTDSATEGRLLVAAGGAARGAGLAFLFLLTFKTAYNARPSAITSTP